MKKSPYKSRKDFKTDGEYGKYVEATLKPGMRVRARASYEAISEGDFGTFKQTNKGSPPAQFAWEGLAGEKYWTFWSLVEILPPDYDERGDDEDWNAGKGESV